MIAANFSIVQNGVPVAGAVTYDDANNAVIFTPSVPLTVSKVYTATISTGAKNLGGSPLATNMVWSFTTGSATDLVAPTVTSTVPANGATGVAVNDNITATFSKAMNPGTIGASFTIAGVLGTVTYDLPNKTAIFNPSANLIANTLYTATITNAAKDLEGNHLATSTWTFTTLAVAGAGPAPVNLATAGNFAVLAKTELNVPASMITGDIGVSPVAEPYILDSHRQIIRDTQHHLRWQPHSKTPSANIPANGSGCTAAGRHDRPANRRSTSHHLDVVILDGVQNLRSCLCHPGNPACAIPSALCISPRVRLAAPRRTSCPLEFMQSATLSLSSVWPTLLT